MDGPIVRLNRESPYLRLQSATVYVRNQDLSLRFYVDQLGFRVAYDVEIEPGFRWVAVAPPDGDAVLAIVAPLPGEEEYNLIGRARHVAFLTEDVAAKFQEWSERGVRFLHPPKVPSWGGIFTVFKDPDGNGFALAGFDYLTRQVEAQRRAVTEKFEAERRAAQELEIAKQVQARLFPQMLPALRTLDYAGVCIQAHAVGGDYYDFMVLGRGRLGLVIGDIAGKGIAAALLMANLQANIRSQSAIALDDPQCVLQSVNRLFYENTIDSAYATLIFAEYDDNLRRLRYVNCGHLPALVLRRDGTVERLHSTSTVLGLFPQWECLFSESQLSSGDILVLYTDGVTEACNDAEEEFGENRLIEALRRYRDQPAAELLASVATEVQRFCPNSQRDDITLIVAKCR
ncbi:PP2C family protein-serine/threonine phosphatase [Edaphobacter bradus]|uniref:PP2C family protein-serine/threonine phosphatase n=1 Tax=Edaphobacter bradus TaxID=2259016 RepID=UPI0021DFF85E|nr:SpoIIE family protein phosphatase [Edaphobacter bradus]